MMEVVGSESNDIRWQCRRGMLELDILLNEFIDHNLADLSEQQKSALRQLLSYPDQVLLDLLLGNTVSCDDRITGIICLIKSSRNT
jgi:antitoxin CptB